MNKKIQEQIQMLQDKWFVITDQEKVLGYLEKVGYHKLLPYFKDANGDIDKVISYYIFDKRLRFLILDMLEVIENALKSVCINYIWESFSQKDRYVDTVLYREECVVNRIKFIENKILEWRINDTKVKNYFSAHFDEKTLPDYIFFDKLTFWELIKIYKDFNLEHQKTIAWYFGINGMLFTDWMYSLKYLRNLCSHYENVFNKTMTFSVGSRTILQLIESQNTFVSYFCLLSVFNKLLIPNFGRAQKVIELIQKFSIAPWQIWFNKKNLPSELESEAWEVLVDKVYSKHIIKSNLFDDEDIQQKN